MNKRWSKGYSSLIGLRPQQVGLRPPYGSGFALHIPDTSIPVYEFRRYPKSVHTCVLCATAWATVTNGRTHTHTSLTRVTYGQKVPGKVKSPEKSSPRKSPRVFSKKTGTDFLEVHVFAKTWTLGFEVHVFLQVHGKVHVFWIHAVHTCTQEQQYI